MTALTEIAIAGVSFASVVYSRKGTRKALLFLAFTNSLFAVIDIPNRNWGGVSWRSGRGKCLPLWSGAVYFAVRFGGEGGVAAQRVR